MATKSKNENGVSNVLEETGYSNGSSVNIANGKSKPFMEMTSLSESCSNMETGKTDLAKDVKVLSEKKKTALSKFKEAVSDILLDYHTDIYLLKWLKAKNYDPQQAEKALRGHMTFRKKTGIEIWGDYKPSQVSLDYSNIKYLGVDKEGDPVVLWIAGHSDFRGIVYSSTTRDALRCMFYIFEYALQLAKVKEHENEWYDKKVTLIVDMQDIVVSHLLDTKTFKVGIELLRAMQDHLPWTPKAAYVLNVPAYFYVFYNSAKPFMNEEIMRQIKIYFNDNYKADLLEAIGESVLPVSLGGQRPDEEIEKENAKHFQFKGITDEVPASLYLKDDHIDIKDEPGLLNAAIKEGTSYIQQIRVLEPKSAIMWCFQTVKYNIDFGVYYVPEKHESDGPGVEALIEQMTKGQIPSECEVIFPVKHVDSHVMPERGEIICDRPGMYVLHFDNTFSWMTPKELFYKAEVVPPSYDQ